MELRISSNPHLEGQEQKKFIDELLERRRALYGPTEHSAQFDKDALELLKSQLKNSSKAIKVK